MTMAHIHWGSATENGDIVVVLVPNGKEAAVNSSGLMMLAVPKTGNHTVRWVLLLLLLLLLLLCFAFP